MRVGRMAAIALAATATTAATAVPAAAAEDVLLPHPGPDGLVWVPEWTGDGGVASGGAWDRLPTVLTMACEGGGSVAVSMDDQRGRVTDFLVDCPADRVGVGSVTTDPGVVAPGSFTIGVDASNDAIRWSLTVTQPE